MRVLLVALLAAISYAQTGPFARLVDEIGYDVTSFGRGILQMRKNNIWKYVCDDVFASDMKGTLVACRELGYPDGRHMNVKAHNTSDFYDSVTCKNGTEESLDACEVGAESDCRGFEAVYVKCGNFNASIRLVNVNETDITSEGAGLLQMSQDGTNWKYVCTDEFEDNNKAGTIACTEMGFDFVSQFASNKISISERAYTDDVQCNGNEERLLDCRIAQDSNCVSQRAVHLNCAIPEPPKEEDDDQATVLYLVIFGLSSCLLCVLVIIFYIYCCCKNERKVRKSQGLLEDDAANWNLENVHGRRQPGRRGFE